MWKSVILFLISTIVTSVLLDLSVIKQYFKRNLDSSSYLLTKEELANYNGVNNEKLYLSILGNIFDVTKGARFYGADETYHIFVGRDNSRSFVTGDLGVKDISDNVIPFNHQEYRSLNNWLQFYEKEYPKVGKLIGRFFDKHGRKTHYLQEVLRLIKEAEKAEMIDNSEKLKFAPCNIEWNPSSGTRVWCTKKSGGIERDWIGVPRQFFEAGAENYRCACINEDNQNLGNIKEYEGCDSLSETCHIIT